MARTVRAVTTENPVTLPGSPPLADAARRMKESDIGDVVVMADGGMCGVVTDRDIVVPAVAEGKEPPVVEGGPVGIVSMADLTIERHEASALADIAAAGGNR